MLENIKSHVSKNFQIYFNNKDTNDLQKVKDTFFKNNLEIIHIYTLYYCWCYALASNGSLWLLDKSHGCGGCYQQEYNYRFFNDVKTTEQGLQIWKAFYQANFKNATEDEVLEFLINIETQKDTIPVLHFIHMKKLCEAFLQYNVYQTFKKL